MEAENQEELKQKLVKINACIQSIESGIALRDKGKAGKLRDELSKAERERNLIVADMNRESNITETNALIEYALEVQKKNGSFKERYGRT